MVFQSFIKFAKFSSSSFDKQPTHRHFKSSFFFKSSYPYLRKKKSLNKYNHDFYNSSKWWFKSPKDQFKSFLTIGDGHYGLYYSMYNHDAERRRRQKDYEKYINHIILKHLESTDRLFLSTNINLNNNNSHFANYYLPNTDKQQHYNHYRQYYYQHHRRRHHYRHHHHCRGGFHLKLLLFGFTAKFLISKAILDNQINLENIKKFSNKFFQSFTFKPAYYIFGYTAAVATIATNPPLTTPTIQTNELTQITSPTVTTQFNTLSLSSVPTTNIYSSVFATVFSKRRFTTSTKKPVQTEPSSQPVKEDTFETDFLASKISSITSTFTSHTNADDLNIIYPLYQSVKRNNLNLPSIDLYNIVLKSILQRSLNNTENDLVSIEERLTTLLTVYQDILSIGMKPNKETYELVVNALLDGSLQCGQLPIDNNLKYNEVYPKSQEFAQLCIQIFNSISSQLDLVKLLPKMLQLLQNYPHLFNADVITPFYSLITDKSNVETKEQQLLILELSKYFPYVESITQQQAYDIIESTYVKYKDSEDIIDPFVAYEKVITSLVKNNHYMRAGQFLDAILDDYRESLKFENRPTKKQIGDLISSFLKSYIVTSGDLNNGYKLFTKFISTAYVPELSVSFYNFIIVELAKQNMVDEMWELYNRLIVRIDYQQTPTIEFVKQDSIACRDLLLSLSIDNGDHERCFQIMKEILVKEHLIADMDVLRKTLHYLYNGVVHNDDNGASDSYFNEYYFGLLWQMMEVQSQYYKTSTDINDFISEFVPFLTVKVPQELAQDLRAHIAVTSYNVNLLLNSPFIMRAVESLDVQTDNVYGLSLVARELIKFDESHGAKSELYAKIAEFESCLINQFEDPDNHYLELTPEMIDFLNVIKNDFGIRVSKLDNFSANMRTDCELDLSGLLQLHFDKGVGKFLEHYNNGSKFSLKTWNRLLNYEFLDTYLSQFNVQELLERIWVTNCDESNKFTLFNRLIDYRFESIVPEVGLFIQTHKIVDNKLLSNLFDTCCLLNVKLTDASFFGGKVDTSEWVSSYLKYLISVEKNFKEAASIVDSLDADLKGKFGYELLEADLELDLVKFKTDFDQLSLPQTDKLVELEFVYDLKQGDQSFDELIDKYKSSTSPKVIELVSFTNLLQTLNSGSSSFSIVSDSQNIGSVNYLATSLLSCGNVKDMNRLMKKATKNTNNDNQLLVSEMISVLANSLNYINNDYSVNILMNKFFEMIKFYKVQKIDSISLDNFIQLMRFLKAIKSDLLVVLLNRFINNGNWSSVVNFYFMEVQVFKFSEKLQVLKEFYNCFKENSQYGYLINEFCHTNGIKL
ncbi:RPM2 Ribonuclease P protein component [Candida maltosa Xu316]